MKTIIASILIQSLMTLSVFAQNVGVGTTTPFAKLEVKSSGSTMSTNNLLLRNAINDTLLRVRDDGRISLNYNGLSIGRSLNIGGNGVNFYNTNLNFGGAIFPTDTSLIIWSNSNGTENIILQPTWGKVGIGTFSPKSKLHVSNGDGGNIYNSESDLIVEDDSHTYLQFSSPTGSASGLLAGNSVTNIRSALLFMADSTVQIRSGGNVANLTIDKSGNTRTSGEIRRTSTGTANIVPICYGSVDANGVIQSGTGNFTVTATPPGFYEITITGESYTNSDYTATATPVSSNPRMLSTGNSGGKLVIRTFTSAGGLVDTFFHFVVYKN